MSELDRLTKEELIGLLVKQSKVITTLSKHIEVLEAEIEHLRSKIDPGAGKGIPDWVKPNRKEKPEQDKKQRKKRKHSFARRQETPTEVNQHTLDSCPDCGRRLQGGWVHRTRQVIEIPQTPVRIIEHQVIARRCGVCGKVHIPKLDLSDDVLGKHRVGVRLMSLVAKLHTECRIPLETVQNLLRSLYGLHISKGELSEILHAVAKRGKSEYKKLLDAIRGSPMVNADETGWRENGLNGYIWSFSTPEVRYFVYNRSRSGDVPKEVLGDGFGGVVVCDFYCGYSVLLGRRQRCWVHFLRDLEKLKANHADDKAVEEWVEQVKNIYRRAKRFKSENGSTRLKKRIAFEDEILGLALPLVKTETPQRVLAERIEKFLPELFVFVEDPRVPSGNNAAERAVRPSVIARKISGGTRSEKGSKTKMTLMSLFGTWKLEGLDTLEACRQMLIGQKSVPTAQNA